MRGSRDNDTVRGKRQGLGTPWQQPLSLSGKPGGGARHAGRAPPAPQPTQSAFLSGSSSDSQTTPRGRGSYLFQASFPQLQSQLRPGAKEGAEAASAQLQSAALAGVGGLRKGPRRCRKCPRRRRKCRGGRVGRGVLQQRRLRQTRQPARARRGAIRLQTRAEL